MTTLSERVPVGAQAAALRATFALPKRVRRGLAGKPIRLDGQELALDAQLLLRLMAVNGTTLGTDTTPEIARTQFETSVTLVADRTLPQLPFQDLAIPTPHGSIGARLYTPDDIEHPSPLLVYYHGGGFAIGSINSHDNTARFLAVHAGVRVLSVDYRLAPEYPFPTGVEDAISAFEYAYAHAGELGVDPERIAVGGDSAGGNFSAAVAQQTTLRGGPAPAFQLLIYPATDFTVRRRSYELFGSGFFLTADDVDWFEGHLITDDAHRTDPRLSPLLGEDLAGLPPAYLVTAGFDPLRDEGEVYARAMMKAGVPVVLQRQQDLVHGFVNFLGAGRRFREATLEIAAALRTGLALAGAHKRS